MTYHEQRSTSFHMLRHALDQPSYFKCLFLFIMLIHENCYFYPPMTNYDLPNSIKVTKDNCMNKCHCGIQKIHNSTIAT